MKHLFAVLVTVLIFAMPVSAEDVVSDSDANAIRQVITDQLDAFRRDDGNTAFGYAAPSIQARFGSAETFMEMVRLGYPAVYRSIDATFEPPRLIGESTIQEVIVTGQDGQSFLAVYLMELQDDSSWRITGCSLVPVPDVQV